MRQRLRPVPASEAAFDALQPGCSYHSARICERLDAPAFAISFSALFALLAVLIGIGRRRADITVVDQDVVVRMGWAFAARIPRASVIAASHHPRIWYAVGVHTMGRGDWIVNGTMSNMVELRIDPPVRARAIGFPVRLRRLRVSVERPDELIVALGSPGDG